MFWCKNFETHEPKGLFILKVDGNKNEHYKKFGILNFCTKINIFLIPLSSSIFAVRSNCLNYMQGFNTRIEKNEYAFQYGRKPSNTYMPY